MSNTKVYNKILIAKYSLENKCFVSEGSILIIRPKRITKISPNVSHHFLSSVDKKTKSKYGWVSEVEPFTFEQFASNFIGENGDENSLHANRVMLESFQGLKLETAVAVSYSKRIEPVRMELHVHRIIFYYERK